MAKFEPTEARKIAATTTDKSEDFLSLCTGVMVSADADCFIDFDRVSTTGSFLIKANFPPVYIPAKFTQIHAITSSGTANLYVLAIRTRS